MVGAANTTQTAFVILWDQVIGAVAWLPDQQYGVFEFDPAIKQTPWDISPITMPKSGISTSGKGTNASYSFPTLNRDTFSGLPGLLSDALPDKFGNAIINTWLARQGRSASSFGPVERLCYMGRRAMGALEFSPSVDSRFDQSVPIDVDALAQLAQAISTERENFNTDITSSEKQRSEAMLDILRVGTSAGGARPKAVIAMNSEGHVQSGQVEAPPGYDQWLIKFDGVVDLELGSPKHFGRIEYAYYQMAKAAGIEMSTCRLLEENDRAHFMTRRFDRINNEKLHMLSLCGIAHFDFNMAGAYSYEQAFAVMRQLHLPQPQAEQLYRRMIFNVIARNQDDHTKNIAFLMNKQGQWKLSPAYDLTYAHNPAGIWTNSHQMSINGKRSDFTLDDLTQVGRGISLKNSTDIIEEVRSVIADWSEYAHKAGIPKKIAQHVQEHHRLSV